MPISSVSAFLLSSVVPHGMRGCRSSAALCVIIASMSIVRHTMPVVLFGGIFATVPLLGIVMRYTIPPLFFVNYVGIVSRHRLFRATNSHVPRCPVCALSVSAFLLSSIVPHGMRGCRSSAALCVSIASMSIVRHDMPLVAFMRRISMCGCFFLLFPDIGCRLRCLVRYLC